MNKDFFKNMKAQMTPSDKSVNELKAKIASQKAKPRLSSYTKNLLAIAASFAIMAGAGVVGLHALNAGRDGDLPVDPTPAWTAFEKNVENAEALRDIAVKPNFEVIENTFEGIDFEIAAIAADGHGSFYLALQMNAKDGFEFRTDSDYCFSQLSTVNGKTNCAGLYENGAIRFATDNPDRATAITFFYGDGFENESELVFEQNGIIAAVRQGDNYSGEQISTDGYIKIMIDVADLPPCPERDIRELRRDVPDEIVKCFITPITMYAEYYKPESPYWEFWLFMNHSVIELDDGRVYGWQIGYNEFGEDTLFDPIFINDLEKPGKNYLMFRKNENPNGKMFAALDVDKIVRIADADEVYTPIVYTDDVVPPPVTDRFMNFGEVWDYNNKTYEENYHDYFKALMYAIMEAFKNKDTEFLAYHFGCNEMLFDFVNDLEFDEFDYTTVRDPFYEYVYEDIPDTDGEKYVDEIIFYYNITVKDGADDIFTQGGREWEIHFQNDELAGAPYVTQFSPRGKAKERVLFTHESSLPNACNMFSYFMNVYDNVVDDFNVLTEGNGTFAIYSNLILMLNFFGDERVVDGMSMDIDDFIDACEERFGITNIDRDAVLSVYGYDEKNPDTIWVAGKDGYRFPFAELVSVTYSAGGTSAEIDINYYADAGMLFLAKTVRYYVADIDENGAASLRVIQCVYSDDNLEIGHG